MSCVVATLGDGVTHMIADRATTDDNHMTYLSDDKIWYLGDEEMGVGAVGDQPVISKIKHELKYPNWSGYEDTADWLHKEVVSLVDKYCKKKSDLILLFAICDELWTVDNEGSVLQHARPYLCVGSGAAFAYGVLWWRYSRCSTDEAIQKAMTNAVECSCEFDPGCSGVGQILTISHDT